MPIDTARFFPRAATTRPRADRSARLLVAAGVSTYGDWLTVVALAVLLYRLTNQPEAPGAVHLRAGRTPGPRTHARRISRRPVRTCTSRRMVCARAGTAHGCDRPLRLERRGVGNLRRGGRRSVPRLDGTAGLRRVHPARDASGPTVARQRDLQRALRVRACWRRRQSARCCCRGSNRRCSSAWTQRRLSSRGCS